MLTAECLYSQPMLKISAQLNDEEFLGTAEDLAAFVSDKLASLGFGDRHRSTERLVRFYAYEGLLSKPERAPDDRRKANFGPLQVRQLLLARLLAERGWDLDRIRTLLHENRIIAQLNKLIDELATPTEAEKLFFRTRGSEQASPMLSEPDARSLKASMRDLKASMGGMSCSIEAMRDFSPSFGSSSPRPSRKTSYATVQQLRQIADSEESPAEALRLMIKKEMARDDLSPASRNLFEQLLAFNPTTPGDEPKTERWTKLRLAHWCEAHFNIDSRITPTKEELQGIVDNFSKALMNKYL
jgi:DNA-binding transcriptional MerR regulator